MTQLVLEKTEIVAFESTMTRLEAIMRYTNVVKRHILVVKHLGLLQTIVVRGSIAVSAFCLNLFQYAAQSLSHSLFPYFSMCFRQQLSFWWKIQTIVHCKLQQFLQQKDALKPVHKFLAQTVAFMYFI